MKTFMLAAIAALILASAARAVMVDGCAYLSNQSDHSNTKVLFRAVSPSAQTDSTFTDGFGAFQIDLHPGVYNVDYTHSGYARYPLPNQALLFATTLPPVTLMPPLSGSLSGTLGPGDYQVVDSINVESGEALTILPGTRLYFEPLAYFAVRGVLHAAGAEEDSIMFTKRYASPDSLWGGIAFLSADSNSVLANCVVEYSYQTGITCTASSPTLANSTIRYNGNLDSRDIAGGLMCMATSNPRVAGCHFLQNSGDDGGGIHMIGGSANFSNCLIDSNHAGFAGGGFYFQGGSPALHDCDIRGNSAGDGGGGIFATDSTELVISNCRVLGNAAGYEGGGGIFFHATRGATPRVQQCLITANAASWGSGVYVHVSSAIFEQCTIVDALPAGASATSVVALGTSHATFNSCVIVSYQAQYALSFGQSPNSRLEYCALSAGASCFQYPENGPQAIGTILLTNARGDSCDTYYNIYRDPMFVDTANGDYHLTADSPCIDAGDPSLPHDPDSTVADIGAFYYDQRLKVNRNLDLHPSAFILSAFPNPFNPVTRLAFDLPRAEDVSLRVYDLTGRLAASLMSGKMTAGNHEVTFDGSNLASGAYFARLEAGELIRTQKLVLLK
jgi:hypothetical protein